jgi:hypothetical protein
MRGKWINRRKIQLIGVLFLIEPCSFALDSPTYSTVSTVCISPFEAQVGRHGLCFEQKKTEARKMPVKWRPQSVPLSFVHFVGRGS